MKLACLFMDWWRMFHINFNLKAEKVAHAKRLHGFDDWS